MTVELRIRVQDKDPDAEMVKWVMGQADGRRMILTAIRAYWLVSSRHDSGRLTEQTVWLSLNALAYQFNFVAQAFDYKFAVDLLPLLNTANGGADSMSQPTQPTPATDVDSEAVRLFDQTFS